jgi:hypothetical protein
MNLEFRSRVRRVTIECLSLNASCECSDNIRVQNTRIAAQETERVSEVMVCLFLLVNKRG